MAVGSGGRGALPDSTSTRGRTHPIEGLGAGYPTLPKERHLKDLVKWLCPFTLLARQKSS